MASLPELTFGWFIPTAGDTTAFGDPSATTPPSLEMFVRVARAAEAAGFEFALVPVQTACYEAWVSCAMISARTERLKMLVAARPGYIKPHTMAKMVSTFDQLSGGRVYVNLIAGPGGAEEAAEGSFVGHDDRYALMDETVSVMKALWAAEGPVHFDGDFTRLVGGTVRPRPLQRPHPPFYIGGISEQAMEVCGKHADVFLAWLDTPAVVAQRFAAATEAARRHGREDALALGVRAQVMVRDSEEEAWAAADALIARATAGARRQRETMWTESEADARMVELATAEDWRLGPHLWAGVTSVRPGAGVLIVGTPRQVADTILEYVDLGATQFCLSGYPHDEAATRFGRDVMPLLR